MEIISIESLHGLYFTKLFPDLLDMFFTDMSMPYEGFGPSYFVEGLIPDIDTNHHYYVSPKIIDEAIQYLEKVKNDDTRFPKQIIKSGL